MDHHTFMLDEALSDRQLRAIVSQDLDRRLDDLPTDEGRQRYLRFMAQIASGKLAIETSSAQAAAEMRSTMRVLSRGNYPTV